MAPGKLPSDQVYLHHAPDLDRLFTVQIFSHLHLSMIGPGMLGRYDDQPPNAGARGAYNAPYEPVRPGYQEPQVIDYAARHDMSRAQQSAYDSAPTSAGYIDPPLASSSSSQAAPAPSFAGALSKVSAHFFKHCVLASVSDPVTIKLNHFLFDYIHLCAYSSVR